MGAGLRKTLIPVFAGGGIDSKTDPRLVEGGALIELENMYMQRNGELRFRNGYTSKGKSTVTMSNGFSTVSATVSGIKSMFRCPTGEPGIVASLSGDPGCPRTILRLSSSGTWLRGGSGLLTDDTIPYPLFTIRLSPGSDSQDGSFDAINPDTSFGGGQSLLVWSNNVSGGQLYWSLTDATTGAPIVANAEINVTGRIGKTVYSGNRHCIIYLDNAGTPSLKCLDISSTGATTTTTVALNAVSAANPWFDAILDPNSGRIAIAYNASAGGVTCLLFDVGTHTVAVGPVNTAGADASMAIGWQENHVTTSLLLATAGTVSGVAVRVMNSATLAVTATDAVDPTATASIRSISGFVRTSDTDYGTVWDLDATPTYDMSIRIGGKRTVIQFVNTLNRGVGLVSRVFYNSADSLYYYICSRDSTLQPAYLVFPVDATYFWGTPQATALYLSAGGRNVATNALVSVWSSSTGVFNTALTNRTRTTLPGGAVNASARSVRRAVITTTNTQNQIRELGGTVFSPGGILIQNDGKFTTWATFPLYPEKCSGVSSATGSMTPSGTYDYVAIYKLVDSNGRILRSAPSVAFTITLGAGDGRVTVSVPMPYLYSALGLTSRVELYRRGPTATGATAFNKVADVGSSPSGGAPTVDIIDSMSDANAAASEFIYTTGNVLENFPPPSTSLLEVNQGRLWVVNAEDPTELWPSKEYKPGVGIGFHQNLAFRVTGDGYGPITALAAMDGRLIVFKSSAIYVVSGDGPDDSGANGSFTAQAVSLSIGTVLPGSVVATPDGIMFQSGSGIYLLSRGLGVTYLGKAVEKYTRIENVVDASLVTGQPQVRFVQASGRCLVWDYDLQRWYTFTLPVGNSTVVACADIPSGWCYALADGTVKQEVAGQYSDDGVAIAPRVTFPYVNVDGINGFQRVYAIDVLGEYVGNHTLKASLEYDYDGIAVDAGQRSIAAGAYQYEIKPPRQKCSSMKLTLTCTLASGSGGFRLTAVSFLVGVKRGPGVPFTRRFS